MTAAVLSPGGRATTLDAAEDVARAELGTDDVSVVEIVERRPVTRVQRVAVVGPATSTAAPARATTLHARLDRALRAHGLPGLDATHVLPAPGSSADDAASATTRRLSVVHALLVESPTASPSGFTGFAHVRDFRGYDPENHARGR